MMTFVAMLKVYPHMEVTKMKKKQLIIFSSIAATLVLVGAVTAAVLVPRLQAGDSSSSDITSSEVISSSSSEVSVPETYTVTWLNYDGTILEVDEDVAHGAMPTYNGNVPTKESTAQFTYTFTGWSPELIAVTSDATYTAQFSDAVNHYFITWKNSDGTVLKTDSLAYGTMPLYEGEAPIKAKTAQYTYTFSGWSPEIVTVTSDASYTATFAEQLNKYTVTWLNDDGTLLKTDADVEYGTIPEFTEGIPVKDEAPTSTFTFSGWDPEITPVTGDVTYTATFSTTFKKFQITLDLNGGALIDPETPTVFTVEYSSEYALPVINAPSTTPFGGWYYNDVQVTNEDGVPLTNFLFTEDITVVAEFFVPIYTREDLIDITLNLTETYRLMNDLDLSGEEWIPIDDFAGDFNGQDYVISGMTITTKHDSVGLFGKINAATISHLTLRDSLFDITEGINDGWPYSGGIGGIIGSSTAGHDLTLHALNNENMTMTLARDIARYIGVGGIIGLIDARKATTVTITNVSNSSDITLEEFERVGGLIGSVRHDYSTLTIKDSHNSGTIVGQVDIGGFIGYFYGYETNITIEDSYNVGEITSLSVAGGFIGVISLTYSSHLTIKNSYNTHNITAIYQGVGGLVGSSTAADISSVTISQSYNTGQITGESRIGGLVGGAGRSGQRTFFPEITFTDSYNAGAVSGIGDHVENIGGIIGNSTLVVNILSSYNSGDVRALQKGVGGLVGQAENGGLIDRSLSLAPVQGNTLVGGIIGINKNNDLVITDSYYTGVTLNMNNEPFVGPTPGGTVIDLELITKTFFSDTLLWDEEVWDLSQVDSSNKIYPTLK